MTSNLETPAIKSAPLVCLSSSDPSSNNSNELEMTSNLQVIPNVVEIVEAMVHRAQIE